MEPIEMDVEKGRQLGAFANYKKFRERNLSLVSGEQLDLMFEVYRALTKANPDMSTCPFPTGLDRHRFHRIEMKIRMENGSFYAGPNIPKLMMKVIRAYEVALDNRWKRDQEKKRKAQGVGQASVPKGTVQEPV